jgi:hypothetical protein
VLAGGQKNFSTPAGRSAPLGSGSAQCAALTGPTFTAARLGASEIRKPLLYPAELRAQKDNFTPDAKRLANVLPFFPVSMHSLQS